MHVTQSLLQPDHGLAVGGKAKMAGFDDAGVHRPYRNLVQALAFRWQKRIGFRRWFHGLCGTQGMAQPPAAMVKPRTMIGVAFGLKAAEFSQGPFQPDSGWMPASYRGETPCRTRKTGDAQRHTGGFPS